MPRSRKRPRLYLKKREAPRHNVWIIRDGAIRVGTGCGEDDTRGAEEALAQYIAEKYKPPGALPAAELYIDEVVTRTSQPHRRAKSEKFISEQTARHDLKTLRTAINWYHGEYPLPSVPKVWMPPKAPQRDDYWLTRDEVAARIRAARKNERTQHVARQLLIGVRTGTRPGAILGLKWQPSTTSGWFDLENGVLHRRGTKSRRTRKRQPPVRIHAKLVPHLLRWRALDLARGITSVIDYQGRPVKKLRNSWNTVARAAGATRKDGPHITRHTAATWQMLGGTSLYEAAGYLGMTPEILWETYGHHHPDHHARAARADTKRGRVRA
jgi:integrase